MNRSTVSRIAPIIANILNVDAKRDRARILEEIHKGESLLYSALGEETREAFFKGSGCVPVVQYRQDCRSRCRSQYLGFSLPAEVERAEVFRIDGERIPLQGRHSGPAGEWSCRPRHCTEAMDLGSGWSLPVDPCLPCHLGFKLRADGEKAGPVSVGITYFDANGTMQREDVEVLADTITLTRFPVSVLAMGGITIIGDRCHYLEVWEEMETLITEIHPSIDVPDFHRYALSGQVCATSVEFEDGQFQPLRQRFDSDSVVTGDPNLWENLMQWRTLHFQTKRTPSEERAYGSSGQFLMQQAQQALKLRESDSEIITIEPVIPYRNASMNFRDLGRRHLPVRFPRRR
jgi:hypothetical protein